MKKHLLLLGCLLSVCSAKAQLTLDAESGNRTADQATGWGFGGHGYQTTVVISGSYSIQSQQLSNADINNSWIKTPWVIFQSGNITFDSRLGAANGTSRYIAIRFIPYDCDAANQEGTISDTIYWFNHPISTSVQNLSYAVPSMVLDGKPWKMMISYGGVGGNSRIVSDNYSIPGLSAFYDTDADNIPDAMDKYRTDATNNGKSVIFARAWDDQDGDGIQDACEPGLDGLTVRERSSTGSHLSVTTTKYNGWVAFFDITNGSSRIVEFGKPTSNFSYTLQDQGSNDAIDSDIGSNGRTGVFSVTGVVTDVAGGLLAPGTVNAFVWDDQDGDGVQDSGEPGISGATVRLRWASGSQIAAATTDANGIATFTNVPAGQALKLDFERRTSNHWFTGADAGSDDALDSDGDTTDGMTANFTLTKGSQVYEDMDNGQWAPGTVKAFVWDDQNGDGINDSGEPGISGTTVRLRWASGSQIAATTTDAFGVATFTNVPAGRLIKLDFDLRNSNHWFTGADAGSDDALDSDGDTTAGMTANFSLTKGSQVYDNMDNGQWAPGTVTVFVFEDTDYDGIQDSGEPGISGRTVRLRWPSGSQISAVTSDINGIATLTNVPAGKNLKLEISRPTDHIYASQNIGSNEAVDSDPDYETGYTDEFSLTKGSQNYTSMDAGMININLDSDSDGIPNYLDKYVYDAGNNSKAAILSRVWDDRDGDGRQDANEPGIGSVTVRLRNSGGSLLQTRTTHASAGLVAFFDLTTGSNSILEVTKPTGTIFTTQDVGTNEDIDSDIQLSNSRTAAFTASGVVLNQDAGVLLPGTINTFVWNDLDGDGVQDSGEPGISGVSVRIRNSGGSLLQTEVTGTNGVATFTDVPTGVAMYLDYTVPTSGHSYTLLNSGTNENLDSDADPATTNTETFTITRGSQTINSYDCGMWAPGTVTTFVWDDQDGDGIQDSGEPALANVSVNLRNGTNTGTLQTVNTDVNGLAVFTNVAANVDHRLRYSLPTGHAFTAADQGSDDALDSDADPTSTVTATFKLTQGGQSYTQMDCGMWAPGTVNAYVWDDRNADGIQDAGEPALANVSVNLRNATNTSSVQTATTNANGLAVLTNVAANVEFRLRFNVPTGHAITLANQGSDEALDSDADPATTVTGTFKLTQGSQAYTLMDCGMWAPGTVTTFVWDDQDGDGIQDSGEPGLTNVAVNLRNSANTSSVQTANTNSSGIAVFSNVAANVDYRLRYSIPSGRVISAPDQGSNDTLDSDADVTTRTTATFKLTQGSQSYTLVDCGMKRSSLRIVQDEPVAIKMQNNAQLNVNGKAGNAVQNQPAVQKPAAATNSNSQVLAAVTVYPNPAAASFNVYIAAPTAVLVNYVFTDVAGKVVRNGNWQLSAGANTFSLDVNNLPAGVYQLRVEGGDITHSTRVIVIR